MRKIILDTSFLLDLIRFRIPLEEIGNLIYGKYKIFIPTAVIDELKNNPSKHARAALKLIRNVKVLQSPQKSADRAIIDLIDEDVLVATNDKELRAKLKGLGIKTIYLRAKKHLAIG